MLKDAGRRRSGVERVTTLILEVFRLNGSLIATGDGLVEDLGLTSARWQVLGALALSSSPQTVADVARTMGLARQSVQRLANDLMREGLLSPEDNPRHTRAPLMQLTERGRATYAAATKRQVVWANELARGIPGAELETAGRILRMLTVRLQGRAETSTRRTNDARRHGPKRTDRAATR